MRTEAGERLREVGLLKLAAAVDDWRESTEALDIKTLGEPTQMIPSDQAELVGYVVSRCLSIETIVIMDLPTVRFLVRIGVAGFLAGAAYAHTRGGDLIDEGMR